MKNWLVVADKAESKVYSISKVDNHLTLVHSIRNENAGLKDHDLSPADYGNGKVALKHSVDQYVHQLFNYLVSEKNKNSYNKLMVAAEPNLLGVINKQFEHKNLNVAQTIHHELSHLPKKDLEEKLREDFININFEANNSHA